MFTDGLFWLSAGKYLSSWGLGVILTIVSFIFHRNSHPKAAAALAVTGYLSKLPVYIIICMFFFDGYKYSAAEPILLWLTTAAIMTASTGYTVHMIKFAVQGNKNKHDSSEE